MFKRICPYCGGRCETTGGPDGNPFNKDHKEKTVCTACGRTVSESEPLQMSDDVLKELMTDIDAVNDTDNLKIKISATAEGGGGTKKAEITIPYEDGSYSLGTEYPFGRVDIDKDPPFNLQGVKVQDNEIFIANETVKLSALMSQTITKKLTAYGYGYVPWEETITITISIE